MESDRSNGRNDTWLGTLARVFSGKRKVLTEEELHEIIEESELEGIINEEEGEMLHSIFEFGETVVREVMVPRPDMICCSATSSLEEVLEAIIGSGHSRIPIFDETPDRIIGIVYAKDLLRHWGKPADKVKLAQVMRSPYFVPETKRVEDLLKEFRSKRVHMAIAIDEYGGTSGLITIEDLIEEIIGDIQDEYDAEDEWMVPEQDGALLVDARLNIEELEEFFDIEIPREKFDTVGGYIFDKLGYVPRQGEMIEDGELVLKVVESDPSKIRRVRVERQPSSAVPAEES